MTYKILLVDDEPANLRLLARLFRHDYNVVMAASGEEALRLLQQHDVALIITDQRMPGMTGLELLKSTTSFRPHIVRILLTGYTDVNTLVDALNWGEVYRYVTKPWNNDDLRATVSRAIEHYESRRAHHELLLINQRLNARLKQMTEGFVCAIVDALEAKDGYVYGHARRVRGYAMATGKHLNLDEKHLEQLSLAAVLHDIGRIGTPDHLLMKAGALDEKEMAVMRLHCERGARMLAGIPDMQDVAEAVRHHHEHYDGTGYPEGLKGEQIPLLARIIFVADVYDAITSPRPFREAFDHDYAVQILKRGAGTKFDAEVVRAFLKLDALSKIRNSLSGDLGRVLRSIAPRMIEAVNMSGDDLARTVETNLALAACVLMEANRNTIEPTAKIREACERLGEEALREVILRNYDSSEEERALDYEKLREHSLRCATSAILLAERTQVIGTDEAYTLGLLHNIGELILRALFPEEMEMMTELSDEERDDEEVAAFGVDHAQVGQWVLELCGLPRKLSIAVQAQHGLMRINDPVALLLHVANAIANADAPYKVASLDNLGSGRVALLGLERAELADVHASMSATMEGQFAAA